LETLLQADRELLLFFNSIHSPLWDNFFWIFTSTPVWIPFYFSLVIVFFKRMKWQGFWMVLALGSVIILCDQISSGIFKELFERLRPSHEPSLDGIVRLVNGKRGGKYGFVSSHAANSFGLAMFTAVLFRKWYFTLVVFVWAIINSYSRIYMGLHYPGDILGGLMLGILVGLFVYWLFKQFNIRYLKSNINLNRLFDKDSLLPIGILFTTCFVIFFSAKLLLKMM
jgi:undecaprenyl-diphosphatase